MLSASLPSAPVAEIHAESHRCCLRRCGRHRDCSRARPSEATGQYGAVACVRRHRAATSAHRYGTATSGSDRAPRLPARSGHHDLGPGHRRTRRGRAAQGLPRRGRQPGRHRRRVRGRGRGVPPLPADRGVHTPRPTWSSPPRRAACRTRTARFDGSRGHLLSALDASLRRLGTDYVDLWQVHASTRGTPARGDPARAGPGRLLRQRPLRRRVATTAAGSWPGRHLAARGPRPRATGQHPDGVLAAPARHGARGAAGRRWTRASGCCPASPLGRGVLTGKYRHRHPRGLPRRLAVPGRLRPALPGRAARRIVDARRHGRGRAGGDPARRSPWPGYATGPGSSHRSSAHGPRRSSRRRCQWSPLRSRRRSAELWTRSRHRSTSIPTTTGAPCERGADNDGRGPGCGDARHRRWNGLHRHPPTPRPTGRGRRHRDRHRSGS